MKEEIDKLLKRVQSGSVAEKNKALPELKYVLESNRRNPDLAKILKGETGHTMFEILFRVASKERSLYVKATIPNTREKSASRLTTIASMFRLVVDIALPKIRTNILKALLGHIIEILPMPSGGLCQPLSLDYLKALNGVLASFHVEHLSRTVWLNTVDFGIACVKTLNGAEPVPINHPQDSTFTSTNLNISNDLSLKTIAARTNPFSGSYDVMIELFNCLGYLIAAPNYPLLERAADVLDVMSNYLQGSSVHNPAHYSVLATSNAVFACVSLDSTTLMNKYLLKIIPMLKKLWDLKASVVLLDEILITLVQSKAHLIALTRTKNEDLIYGVEALLGAITGEYFRFSRDRGHLDLDDLGLDVRDTPRNDVMPMQTRSFHLRKATANAEHNWTVVHFLAFLACWIDVQRSHGCRDDEKDNDLNSLPKRRRIAQKYEDLLRQTGSTDMLEKLYSLQVIAFLVHQRVFSGAEMLNIVRCLVASASHQNGSVSSWAFLGIAGCASRSGDWLQCHSPDAAKNTVLDVEFESLWITAWQVASRLMTSVPHSRAACHAMNTLLQTKRVAYEGVAESLDAMMLSVGLNGPALLSDSALALWSTALYLQASYNPGGNTLAGYENMLGWIINKWNPSNFENKNYAHHMAHDLSALDLGRAFNLGAEPISSDASVAHFVNLGIVGHAWLHRYACRELTNYLLLLDGSNVLTLDWTDGTAIHKVQTASTARIRSKTQATILDFFFSEVEKIRENWHSKTYMNTSMAQMLVSFCVVGGVIVIISATTHAHKSEALQKHLDVLLKTIFSFMSRINSSENTIDHVLAAIAPFIPGLPGDKHDEMYDPWMSPDTVTSLAYALEIGNTTESDQVDDLELIDAPFRNLLRGGNRAPRHELAARSNSLSFCSSIAAHVMLLSHVSKAMNGSETSNIIPATFIQYLLSLSADNLLASRPFFKVLFSSDLHFTPLDVEKLLEHLSAEYLEPYEYNRCEVSMGLCLDCMTGTASLWTDQRFSSLAEGGANMYEWFVETTLEAAVCSPGVQIGIATLLYKLLEIQPDYGQQSSRASVRTTLFSVLRGSTLLVQHHVAKHISDIFGLFVPSQHDLIFQDVLDSLPYDVEWIEGISIRLLFLSRLAAAWRTLLRRCLYHIFETAGLVKDALPYSTFCVRQISKTFELVDPRELFRLFSPQLLYTWLDSRPLNSIPYMIFEYNSLRDLLIDVQDELASQLIMRGATQTLTELEAEVGASTETMLMRSFSQAAAYSFAKDICLPNLDGLRSYNAELRLSNVVGGKSTFTTLLSAGLSRVLGHLFVRLDHEDQIEKALAKRQGYEEAYATLKAIKGASSSEISLVTSQQPSFRTKHLLDEIERVCRRVSTDMSHIWTPPVIITIVRMLMNDIHPVFGSIHTRQIIQKLRILVSLAGRPLLQGYPLEMLLHALRPLTTDKHCAEDALGIFQYLLERGKSHLSQNPSFMAGTCLAVLLSMRGFLTSTQDATTQESQHLATLSKAQAFRTWLVDFLHSYEPDCTHQVPLKAFRSMLSSCQAISTTGNAIVGTPESTLLKHFLDQMKAEKKLLSRPFLELNHSLLCTDFVAPSSFHEDIFGNADMAMEYSVPLWRSFIIHEQSSRNYTLWALKVLGRSFRYAGNVAREICAETDFQHLWNLGESGTLSRSKAAIMKSLADLLHSEDSLEVGAAEDTLQRILSRIRNTEEGPAIENCLPPTTISALSVGDGVQSSMHFREDLAVTGIAQCFEHLKRKSNAEYARDLTITIAKGATEEPLLQSLPRVLKHVDGLAEHLFPYILHLVLASHWDDASGVRDQLSEGIRECFRMPKTEVTPHVRMLINAILYLRSQPVPREITRFERNQWLNIDYHNAASIATDCKMFKSALLFLEIAHAPTSHGAKRLSLTQKIIPEDLLISIYQHIEEPDSFYGVQQLSDLNSVAHRLEFEGNGVQGLLLRGAQSDSLLRSGKIQRPEISRGVINCLSRLSLNNLTQQLVTTQPASGLEDNVNDTMLQAAIKLRRWDIAAPPNMQTNTSILYQTFQSINNATSISTLIKPLECGLLDVYAQMKATNPTSQVMQSSFRTLATLNEIDEVLSSRGEEQLMELWQNRLKCTEKWLNTTSYETASQILSSRDTLFGMLGGNTRLQELLHHGARTNRLMEVEVNLNSSSVYRKHGALQDALSTVTYLSELIEPCRSMGLGIDGAINVETTDVLWELGEIIPSIKMLQHIESTIDWSSQSVAVGRAGIFAALGHRVSEARLEKSAEIQNKYLKRALGELKGCEHGSDAGEVFHKYASYCHNQLTNPDLLDEFQRSERFRSKKQAEIRELDEVIKKTENDEKLRATSARTKARQWLRIDDQEHKRLSHSREQFLRHSIENYLMSLVASDVHDTDMLRFVALWLEHADSKTANDYVAGRIDRVPSSKFTGIMNQMASRLQDNQDKFQSILGRLVERICLDHPFHGMHHIFSGSKTTGGSDKVAISRHAAATKISGKLQKNPDSTKIWTAIYRSNRLYVNLAIEKSAETRAGVKLSLKSLTSGKAIDREVPMLTVPPITISIDPRNDLDYSLVPTIKHFKPEITIAGGLSHPKIVTAIASNGKVYKELFKGGTDDLRQDAIMEQVFDQVTILLKSNKSTRQRDMRIRTYKVIPLNATSGAIEFVQHTTCLNDFLLPAHLKYHPKDLKWNACRQKIEDAAKQNQSKEQRVKTYKDVADRFSPVLRHFFLERFEDPDEWFDRRLAYTRSTAAISILGHVLGLGDRHCQNILLDQHTGEVVHIDLGVAFEAGRILNVPEVVPFRLTRDIVDGFGILKTEGVFRRCCEFTLEALRANKDAIMTLLNVFRYDPLHSWSISPLRAKRLQEDQEREMAGVGVESSVAGTTNSRSSRSSAIEAKEDVQPERPGKKDEEEGGEADRALSVVEKKLAQGLSVTAAVSELIQQATDERNLAVLFCGWAAYA